MMRAVFLRLLSAILAGGCASTNSTVGLDARPDRFSGTDATVEDLALQEVSDVTDAGADRGDMDVANADANGGVEDRPPDTVTGVDHPMAPDVQPPEDGATDTDVPPDRGGTPGRCGVAVEIDPRPGVCDGLGQMACQRWAQQEVDGGYAFARCVSGVDRCARADHCRDFVSSASCGCGDGAACATGEVCAADTPDASPQCRCIVPP